MFIYDNVKDKKPTKKNMHKDKENKKNSNENKIKENKSNKSNKLIKLNKPLQEISNDSSNHMSFGKNEIKEEDEENSNYADSNFKSNKSKKEVKYEKARDPLVIENKKDTKQEDYQKRILKHCSCLKLSIKRCL